MGLLIYRFMLFLNMGAVFAYICNSNIFEQWWLKKVTG